jgi:hypothetical protein
VAASLAEAAVEIIAETDQVGPDLRRGLVAATDKAGLAARKALDKHTDGITKDAAAAGTNAGKALGRTLTREADRAGKQAGAAAADGLSSTSGRLKSVLTGFAGAIAAAFAVDRIASFVSSTIKLASDLSETVNKSNVIFGRNAAAVTKWAQTAATSFGLSKTAALDAAASLGNMFQQLGIGGPRAVKMSQGVVKLAADLGSFNNLETADVLARIQAGFRGEFDSLQALIPNINAARVETEALSITHKKNAKSLTAAEKATATLAIIQRDGRAAANDFAETSGGLANSQKILSARLDDTKAKIGAGLLPIMQRLLGFVADVGVPAFERLAQWVQQNSTTISAWAQTISGAVLVALRTLGGAIATVVSWTQTSVQWLREHEKTAKVLAVVLGILTGIYLLHRVYLTALAVAQAAVAAKTAVMTVAANAQRVAMVAWSGVMALVTAAQWAYSTAANSALLATIRSTTATVASSIATKAVAAATAAWTVVQWALNAAMTANPIGIIIAIIVALVVAIVLAYKNSETFRNIVQAAWSGIQKAAVWAWGILQPILLNIWTALKFLGGVFVWLYQNVIRPIWAAIALAIQIAMVIIKVWFGLAQVWLKILGAAFMWLWENVIQPVWAAMQVAAGVVWGAVQFWFGVIQAGLKVLGTWFTWLYQTVILPVWAGIKAAIDFAWRGIQGIWLGIQIGIAWLVARFRWFQGIVLMVWNGVRQAIANGWAGIKRIFEIFASFIQDQVVARFKRGVAGIAAAWASIKEAAKAPVRFVVETILNNGILAAARKIGSLFNISGASGWKVSLPAGFARGGQIPGRPSHTDNMLAPVASGEFVVNTRQTGKYLPLLEAINAGKLRGYATGGLVGSRGGPAGGPFDFLANPLGALRGFAAKFSRTPGGAIGGALAGVGRRLLTGIIDWIKDKVETVGAIFSGGPASLGSKPGSSIGAILAVAQRFNPAARLSSGFRPGDPGYHGQGLAADLIGGGSAGMARIAKGFYAIANRLLELIHSPSWFVKNGRKVGASFYRSVFDQHFSHVHVAARKDALSFDSAGVLPPGLSTVYNGTGGPEALFSLEQLRVLQPKPVLTDEQWASIGRRVRGGDGAAAGFGARLGQDPIPTPATRRRGQDDPPGGPASRGGDTYHVYSPATDPLIVAHKVAATVARRV